MNILRHETNIKSAKRNYTDMAKLYPELCEVFHEKRSIPTLGYLFSDAIKLVSYMLLLDPKDRPAIYSYLDTGMHAAVSLFRLIKNPHENVLIDLGDGKEFRMKGDEEETATVSEWTNAFYLALILRNEKAIVELCDVPLEKLRKEGISVDAHQYLYIEFLQFLFAKKGDYGTKLLETYKATDPSQLSMAEDWTSLVHVPLLDLFTAILSNDHEEFREDLQEALECHKEYYSQQKGLNAGGVPISWLEDGFFSLPITAIASFAYDNGFKVDVESDYMPGWMVRNEF